MKTMGKALLMVQMAAALMGGLEQPSLRNTGPSPDDIERERLTAKERHRKNLLKRGVQEFNINGKTVPARNYKNALRKAKAHV